jgi:hypothetical protein
LLPPLDALFRAPAFDLPALCFAPPLFFALLLPAPPLALFDLVVEVEDEALREVPEALRVPVEAVREAARVAVRVVFSAALAERLATRPAARVCLRTTLVFSSAALFTAFLTLPVELPRLRVREELLGRITSAAAGLTMPTMLAADSIMPVATFEAWSITSPATFDA